MDAFEKWENTMNANRPCRVIAEDAFRAGMRRAAELLNNRFLPRPSISMEDVAYNTSLRSAIDAILAEADK